MTAPPDVDVRDAAARHRDLLTGVGIVAVTGSCGKTTTKDLIAAVLGCRLRGSKSVGTNNCGTDLARYLLAVQPDDQFFIQELGAWGPGTLDAGISLLRPGVGVVTNLRNDHYSAFHGPRGAQAEKGKLVAALPPAGTAVLNWDDPYVRELAAATSARVFSFGRRRDADLRAVDVHAAWPAPLSFTAVHGRHRVDVHTRLFGAHLLGSALAAMAVALIHDLSLDEAAAALALAEPTPQRMVPVTGSDGVTFIRDDFKAPADSLPEVLAFMHEATATRKLAVFGRIGDYPGRSRPTYTRIAHEATAALDTTIFIGQRAVDLWGEQHSPAAADQQRLRQHLGPAGGTSTGQMYVFETVADATRFLSTELRRGDLVLLKGSGLADHLERILLNRGRPVTCWQASCGRSHACDTCELLTADPPAAAGDDCRTKS
jgi:UDP-N-acetylmuramoyl-tripeptide--D-alanyl-D-alanine ligase